GACLPQRRTYLPRSLFLMPRLQRALQLLLSTLFNETLMKKLLVSLLPVAALTAAPAMAADYPSKTVRIIVGSTAGGVTDTMARLIGSQLTQRLGQSFVVENRAGASGVIGLTEVHRAPADGYTLTMV